MEQHLRPIDRAAGRLIFATAALAVVAAVSFAVYGVVKRSPPDIIIGVIVALDAAWIGRLTRRALRSNSRILFPGVAAKREQLVASANARSAARERVPFAGTDGIASSATLRVRRRVGGRADRLRAYALLIDGRMAGELSPDQSLAIPISPGRHTVHLEIDWCRSRRIPFVISADDTLSLVCGSAANTLTMLLNITIFCKRYIKLRVDPLATD